eukprot:CAMPEP_0113518318 /NCGR_PEP_ID=MMETSP0014_2-20120614/42817_1 /TAXON_ID=2857 /ORGANISM="Nitzschia sp." /LENGTH=392 /DNA_ID=CAMNT_0000415751 /DNA_START=138 /DNA_END=1316 /DNA_ORIENTATION=+ /assembly_acc=CAM_ASM_000159
MAIHSLSTALLVGAVVSSSSSSSSSPPSSTPDAAISSMTATETIVDSILTTINSSMRLYERNNSEIDDGDNNEEKAERCSHQERHRRQRPFVTLTYAQSLDGKIALSLDNKQERSQITDSQKTADETMETDEGTMVSTHSQPQPPPTPSSSSNFAVSGPESLLLTHGLRHVHDAVLIGGRTLLIDNPRLDNRLWTHRNSRVDEGGGGDDDDGCTTSGDLHQPRPVILDPDLKYLRRLGSSLRVAYPDKLIVCYHEDVQLLRDFIDSTTVTFIPCKSCHSDSGDNHHHHHHLDIHDVLQKLRDQCNIESVMVEGGAGVLSAFVAADVVDCYCITVAPILLGRNGLDAFTFAWNSRNDHNAHVDNSDDHRAVSIDLGQLQFIPLGNDCIVLSSR